jgi:hypothetical protein
MSSLLDGSVGRIERTEGSIRAASDKSKSETLKRTVQFPARPDISPVFEAGIYR